MRSVLIQGDPLRSSPRAATRESGLLTNYVEHNFWNNEASLNIRNEVVNDIKGQRSGTPTYYEEHMVGFDFWSGSTVTFRPELSYTRRYSKYKTIDGKPVSCTDVAPGASIASDYERGNRRPFQSFRSGQDAVTHAFSGRDLPLLRGFIALRDSSMDLLKRRPSRQPFLFFHGTYSLRPLFSFI